MYFDEITYLPSSVQSKIAKVLQENGFHRVGGNQKIDIDIRFLVVVPKMFPFIERRSF